MTDIEHFIHNLQEEIGQMKSNEEIYKYKLDLLNQSRSKITDEIDQLSLDYEKKMKQMELKVKRLTTENQTLLKQNQIYKEEIQNFQSRLMEKEKLINMLVSQQSQHLPNLDISVQSDRFEEPELTEKKSNHSSKNKSVANEIQKQHANINTSGFQKKKITPPPPMKKDTKKPEEKIIPQQRIEVNDQEQREEHRPEKQVEHHQQIQQPKQQKTIIPPPPPKNKMMEKHHKPPRQVNNRNIPKYQSPSFVQQTPQNNIWHSQPVEEVHKQAQQLINEKRNQNISNQEQNIYQNTYEQQPNYSQNNYPQQLNYQQQYNYPQQSTHPQQQVHIQQQTYQQTPHEYQNQYPHQQNVYNSQAVHDHQQGNDFLKHFYKEQKQQTQQSSAANFFSHMTQNAQNDINIGSDLQQSSIDYQDNSIMSSNANFFAQSTQLVQPPKKTMPKKKAKRDKIKVADPTLFE